MNAPTKYEVLTAQAFWDTGWKWDVVTLSIQLGGKKFYINILITNNFKLHNYRVSVYVLHTQQHDSHTSQTSITLDLVSYFASVT